MNELIERILSEINCRENPYFVALRNGQFAKEDFVESQIQFYMAVVFFSRPMAALAAKIPTADLRMEVVRNVWEEHGEGNPSLVHGTTFLEFLKRIAEIAPEDVEKRMLWPEVRAFNTTLSGACVLDEYLVGCGVMGMIERMFCEISAWIGQLVVENSWLVRDKMIHYALHEELDIKHSQDFFAVLQPAWDESAENRYVIEQGLWLGATVFDTLYRGLYLGRQRRWLRQVKGPHVRTKGL